MDAINQLVELGNSFIIIEHNMDVIKLADHILTLDRKEENMVDRL
jgi:excinuclease ABC subunit A